MAAAQRPRQLQGGGAAGAGVRGGRGGSQQPHNKQQIIKIIMELIN